MMASSTTEAVTATETAAPLPVPLMLLMLDVMQARGRTEAATRLVDELYARADAADHAGQLAAGRERRPQPTVGQAEVLPPGHAQGCRRRRRLAGPDLDRSAGRGLAVGEIEDAHGHARAEHRGDGAPHAEFGIVWMRGDHEGVEHSRAP